VSQVQQLQPISAEIMASESAGRNKYLTRKEKDIDVAKYAKKYLLYIFPKSSLQKLKWSLHRNSERAWIQYWTKKCTQRMEHKLKGAWIPLLKKLMGINSIPLCDHV
jgi:hypothetical protein